MERRFHRRLEKNGDTEFQWNENGEGDGGAAVFQVAAITALQNFPGLKITKKCHNFLISEQ